MADVQPIPTTTNAGIPVESDEHSLSVGPDGPTGAVYSPNPKGGAGTLVSDVMNDAERERLVDNIVGHLLDGVTEPVLQRAFEYWRKVDVNRGERVEKGVRAGSVAGVDG